MTLRPLSALLTVCLFGTLLIGCSDSSSKVGEGITISVKTTESAPADSFFTDYEFVILETTEDALLHGSSMFRTSDKYIVAYSKDRGFNVFSREGKHIVHFTNKGQGPGETSDVTDYYIKGDEIICVPYMQAKLLVYSAQDGTFTREIPLIDRYYYVRELEDGTMALSPLYSNYSKWNVDIFNTEKQEMLARYLPYEPICSFRYDGFNVFAGQGDECVFGVIPFDNKLYRISANGCETLFRYEFDTPEQIEGFDVKTSNISDYSDIYRYKRVVKWLGRYCEMPSGVRYQHFNLLCDYGVEPFLCKFDGKTSKSQTLCIGPKLFDNFPNLTTAPFEMKEGYYICADLAEDLLFLERNHKKADTFTKLGLKEDDNPVIFFYKLKN